jgi:hypothetical protein
VLPANGCSVMFLHDHDNYLFCFWFLVWFA